MFKKALLSVTVCLLLVLSVVGYTTAFGQDNPANPPPSGLASPTFGGLTVIGAPTSEVMRVTGFAIFNQRLKTGFLDTALIQNGTNDDGWALSLDDNVRVSQNLGVAKNLDVKGYISNLEGDVFVNDNLRLNGDITVSKPGDILLDMPNANSLRVGFGSAYALNPYILLDRNYSTVGSSAVIAAPDFLTLQAPKVLLGGTNSSVEIISKSFDLMVSNLSDGGIKNSATGCVVGAGCPVYINDDLTVTGHLSVTGGIGSFRQLSASAGLSSGKYITSIACPSGSEVVSCGFSTGGYSGITISEVYGYEGFGGKVLGCRATALGNNNSARLYVYATCFNPSY